MNHIEKQNPRYETRDASLKGVAYSAIGLFVLIAVFMMIAYGVMQYLNGQKIKAETPASPLAVDLRPLPPEPRLQVIPEIDLKRYRATQDSLLQSEGWISKSSGVARIPVDVAMKLVLERGFPVRKEAPQTTKGR